jgi:hypothetical protein
MDTTNRTETFTNTLREACSTRLLGDYNNQPPIDKFITLTGNLYDLYWEIMADAKTTHPAKKIIAADRIKYNATNVINICVAELKNLGHTNEATCTLIAHDCTTETETHND